MDAYHERGVALDVDFGGGEFRPGLLGLPEGYGTCRITAQDAYAVACLKGIYRVDRVALAFGQAYSCLLYTSDAADE